MSKQLNKRNLKQTLSLSGKFTDIETLYASKSFLDSINSNHYDCRFDNAQFIEGFRNSYIFNSSIQEVDNADAILLIGSNPRWEASVLNARIRKAYIQNKCKIGLIGKKIDLTYKYEHLDEKISYLNEILNGRSKFFDSLKNAKKPMIIIGSSAINFKDGQDVIKISSEICKKLNTNFNSFYLLIRC